MVSIRPLREDDDTSSFHSGNDHLDRFFRRHAAKNQFSEYIGTTFVAVEAGEILGYATVAPASIGADDFPSTRARKLPKYPLPALRLGRLAVARSAQKKGVGTLLLRYVFTLGLEMAGKLGCTGVLVDAKSEAVQYYEKFGFEHLASVEGQVADHPDPATLFLHIETIRAALS